MLLVDERNGSKELLKPLLMRGVPAEITHLEFGDFAFNGRGEGGADITIGVELKTTQDLLSSLLKGRFSGHQLRGLVQTYDRVWLLTEGDWKATEEGLLTYRTFGRTYQAARPPTMVRDLYSRLINISVRGGAHYWHTQDREDTVLFLATLYHYWTDVSLDEHKSHLGIYNRDLDRSLLAPITLVRSIAAQLPGIGYGRSGAVAKMFKSVEAMVNASEKEWRAIEGIGPKTAKNVVEALRGK